MFVSEPLTGFLLSAETLYSDKDISLYILRLYLQSFWMLGFMQCDCKLFTSCWMCLLVLPPAGLDESGAPAQEQADEEAQTQTKFGLLSL